MKKDAKIACNRGFFSHFAYFSGQKRRAKAWYFCDEMGVFAKSCDCFSHAKEQKKVEKVFHFCGRSAISRKPVCGVFGIKSLQFGGHFTMYRRNKYEPKWQHFVRKACKLRRGWRVVGWRMCCEGCIIEMQRNGEQGALTMGRRANTSKKEHCCMLLCG